MFLAMLLVGCSGKEIKEEKPKKETEIVEESDKKQDTIWLEDIEYAFHYSLDFRLDTSILIGGESYYFQMTGKKLPNEYIGTVTKVSGDSIIAQKHRGPNSKYEISLYDSLDNKVSEVSWDKYDLESYIPKDLLAGSRGDFWYYEGFHNEFNSFFLVSRWMFEDSDVGEEFMVFLNKELQVVDFFSDSFTGGGACQCNYEPSPGGKAFAFCSRIYRSKGKHTDLTQSEEPVVGSFQLKDDVSLVIRNYQGKPPYNNAKLLSKNGRVLNSFDFLGIEMGLGYIISYHIDESENIFYLVDDQSKVVFIIDRNQATKVNQLMFEELPDTLAQVLLKK